MGISQYKIIYSALTLKKEIPLIPSPYKEAILRKIESKLTIDPYKYGKPLDGQLKGRWSLKVGGYRVIYRIDKEQITVLILTIDVRGNVYER